MSKKVILLFFVLACLQFANGKTVIDLMREGRFHEAKAILDTTAADTRYTTLWYAMQESDGMRACSLYQIITARYPGTDVDTLARERLKEAVAMGMKIKPIPPQEPAIVPIAEAPASSQIPSVQTPVEQKQETTVVAVSETTKVASEMKMVSSAPSEPPTSIPVVETPVSATAPAQIPVPQKSETTVVAIPESSKALSSLPFDPIEKEPVNSEPKAVVKVEPEPVGQIKTQVQEESKPAVTQEIKKDTVKVASAASINKTVKPVAPKVKPRPETLQPHDKPLASEGHWFVQVGAFANQQNAEKLADKLRGEGYSVILVPRELPDKTLMQVRVGGYSARENCEKAAAELKEKFKLPSVILHD